MVTSDTSKKMNLKKALKKVGAEVSVSIPDPFWSAYAFPKPKERCYTSKIVAPFSWCGPNSFCIEGAKEIAVRVIYLPHVSKLAIDGVEYSQKEIKEIFVDKSSSKDQEFIVKGSTGNDYKVKYSPKSGWSCNCTGFGFRGKCKHIESKKDSIK